MIEQIQAAAAVPAAPSVAERVARALTEAFDGPCYCTPDGLQAPLLAALARGGRLENVVREDLAIGMAAGSSMAGRTPVVLMQNSGLGQSVNALASLVQPYGLAMVLVVGMRGTGSDHTAENAVMGRITEDLLRLLDVPTRTLTAATPEDDVRAVAAEAAAGRTAALLVPPGLFGWEPTA